MRPGEIIDIDDDSYGDDMPEPPPGATAPVDVKRVRLPLFDDEPLATE